ncbi:LysR family transcriptional regulator [Paenibacillus lemnae]|uniref:LysR family transcriptional regulator n=1 Tax=Paenibacillus lemnae TaxID=1330551 RepID=A0A848M434_PAELE|nr:LysR family transcriptional regulator [Paenibacillus lemnae]NMO94434.1 LysR family transcriptional regulator [Paenibacillus lemnae]
MDMALEVFIKVADKGSFTQAAAELNMTQPAVSQYIRALERSVGAKLLDRTNKYVRPTQAGEIVYHHARIILGTYTRMQTLVDDVLHRAGGELSIGSSYTFGEYVLPRLLANLKSRYPLIRPNIKIGNTDVIADMILNREADIGIVEDEYQHEKLAVEAFAEDEMLIVVPAEDRFNKKSEIGLEVLMEETWILRESGSGTRRVTERMFSERGVQPASILEFGSTQLIKESVEAGLGITLLSRWTVQKELKLGTLHVLRLSGDPVKRPFSLLMQPTPYHTKAVQVFLELLKELSGFQGLPSSSLRYNEHG